MRLAAGIAVGAAVVDLLVLGLLHVVSPEVYLVARCSQRERLGRLQLVGHRADGRSGPWAHRARCGALRRERLGAVLLLVFGLLKSATPFFLLDVLGAPVTSAGEMHNLLGNLTFFPLPAAASVLFRPSTGKGGCSGSAGCCGAGDRDGRSSGGERSWKLWLNQSGLPYSVCGLAASRRFGSTSQEPLRRSCCRPRGCARQLGPPH